MQIFRDKQAKHQRFAVKHSMNSGEKTRILKNKASKQHSGQREESELYYLHDIYVISMINILKYTSV